MTQILVFPLTLRSPSEGRREGTAVITPFPLVRYTGEVDRVARRIMSLPTHDQRQEAMVAYVTTQWRMLNERGVDPAAPEEAIVKFSQAVWALVDQNECGVTA